MEAEAEEGRRLSLAPLVLVALPPLLPALTPSSCVATPLPLLPLPARTAAEAVGGNGGGGSSCGGGGAGGSCLIGSIKRASTVFIQSSHRHAAPHARSA